MNVAVTIALLVLCALVAYALGSLNFGIIISKLVYKDDIRNYGSGNAGTTNMLRTYGKKAAIATIIGDALKVVVAIIIGNILVGSALFCGEYIAGFFAVLGHVYPVYYKFKGGKGVVASAITMLMLDWRVFLIVFGFFVIVVAIWRYISLGSILSAAIYPMVTYAASITDNGQGGVDVVFAFILGVFVIVLHRTNIQRLLSGKENKLSFKKTDKKAADKK
ncbi:MAG: glycerol-3-phosphate 1-O-acyltransferase PlsY [Clostridia bacterium]|nr:glycerol-3-phosphate 1-O-acyltransferase PlsY [Clostridia bacterium]